MGLDFEKIKQAAEGYRADMTAFLRAMISHPSESCEEKEVVASSQSTLTSILLVSVTSTTGKLIRTKAMRPMRSSTAAAVPTRKAVWQVLFTAQRS